jgi:hypothetical protein
MVAVPLRSVCPRVFSPSCAPSLPPCKHRQTTQVVKARTTRVGRHAAVRGIDNRTGHECSGRAYANGLVPETRKHGACA